MDILGHIFEQSITDLERLRNELDGLTEPVGADKHKTRRKKEGAFYTPAFITRYIIEQALGGVLRDRFEQLRQRHEQDAKGTARTALADPGVYELDKLNKPQQTALVQFWEAWQDELAGIRLLDPACGSGAFLIEAFDQLHAAYQASNDRLQELRGHRSLFDLDRRILEHNLYGVDLNDEAIEICRLSLWIKTAQRGKTLASLDHPIRVGNSVVADPAVHPKAFDWQAAFPEVFKAGGFDVVVGNPPYVRQELLSPIKPYLQSAYRELPRHGRPLRVLLRAGPARAEARRPALVRGHQQVDEGRLRRAAAAVLRRARLDRIGRGLRPRQADLRASRRVSRRSSSRDGRRTLPSRRPPGSARSPASNSASTTSAGRSTAKASNCRCRSLGADAWQLESTGSERSAGEDSTRRGVPLAEFAWRQAAVAASRPGCNDAFLIDTPTKNRIVSADPNVQRDHQAVSFAGRMSSDGCPNGPDFG